MSTFHALPNDTCQTYATLADFALRGASKQKVGSNRLDGDSRGQHQDLDACDGHNSSSSGSGGGPFSSFTRSPNRLVVRDLFGAQETAFEQLRLHLKHASEGEEELPTDFWLLKNLRRKKKILDSRARSEISRVIVFVTKKHSTIILRERKLQPPKALGSR